MVSVSSRGCGFRIIISIIVPPRRNEMKMNLSLLLSSPCSALSSLHFSSPLGSCSLIYFYPAAWKESRVAQKGAAVPLSTNTTFSHAPSSHFLQTFICPGRHPQFHTVCMSTPHCHVGLFRRWFASAPPEGNFFSLIVMVWWRSGYSEEPSNPSNIWVWFSLQTEKKISLTPVYSAAI